MGRSPRIAASPGPSLAAAARSRSSGRAIDSNVLINLMHVSRLGLLGSIPGHEFVVPDHVRPWARAMRYEMELARRRTPPVVARWLGGRSGDRSS
jgi:hypothetical protein